jgi:hypothetical protein
MSSLLSLCSSEEDAFIELISTNSFSPSSSSFEDLYYKEQDNTSDSSCSCSLSSRSPRYWDGHQDDKVQTQVNSSLARTIEEGSSSILLRMTGISSRTGGIIKKPYNVEDSNNGILVNHLALHDSSNTKNMPYDSRDDDEEENDRTLDEFEEPRIPPPNFPSVLPPQYSLLYEGRGCFNEDGNYIDDITEKGISNQSLSRNPKRISQRIRCFQVKKLMREKNKHSSNKEDFTSYMPLLENASVTPMNFQKHELIVSPLAKKLKSVNTQTTKAAWDYPWNDVVVKELQAPRRSTPKDNGSATDTPDVISESITKSAFSQTRAKSPPLSCFLTIDEKEEEHGSSARTHGTISVSKTVVDPSDHKLHDGKEEIITTVPNLVNFVSSSSLVLDQHSDDFPTRTSRIDCHRYEDNTMKELLSFHQHTKSRPGTFVMSPSAAGNKQATDVQLDKVVLERETCNMRKTSQGMVYQEILHDDRPTTRVKEGIMFKTTKSVSTQTSPTKQETFSSLLSILNIPADVKDHLPSDSSSIGSGCDSIFPRHDDIDKMMTSKRGSDGGDNNSATGGLATCTGFSKSSFKELDESNEQQNRKKMAPSQVTSGDDHHIKSTKEESKALQFWAMAQRRAKTGSDVHVH